MQRLFKNGKFCVSMNFEIPLHHLDNIFFSLYHFCVKNGRKLVILHYKNSIKRVPFLLQCLSIITYLGRKVQTSFMHKQIFISFKML